MARGRSAKPEVSTRPLGVCPIDGGILLASGICVEGGGYPYGTPCPFACPICRTTLSWSGLCGRCYGRRHDTDPRQAPGDRYEMYDDELKPITDGHHWVKLADGPQAMPSVEQTKEIARYFHKVVATVTTKETPMRALLFALVLLTATPALALPHVAASWITEGLFRITEGPFLIVCGAPIPTYRIVDTDPVVDAHDVILAWEENGIRVRVVGGCKITNPYVPVVIPPPGS